MATVHIALFRVTARQPGSGGLPVPNAVPIAAATLTSSSVSAASALIAPDEQAVWSVTAAGGNVFVAFAADPTAAADAGWLVLDGQTRDFTASGGEKVAIKDA